MKDMMNVMKTAVESG